MNKGNQSGFTIVELVAVIVVLGILAAVALPRFMDASERAHDSRVLADVAAFATGVDLVKTQWYVNGNSDGDPENDVDGYGDGKIDVTGGGWPYAVNADATIHAEYADTADGRPLFVTTPQECAELWMAIMNGPTATQFTGIGLGADYDYVAYPVGPLASPTGCQYGYTADTDPSLVPAGYRWLTYSFLTGVVSSNVVIVAEEGN